MRAIVIAAVAAAVAGGVAIANESDSFSGPVRYERDGPPVERLSLYERISAYYRPMGREVREEFRDGPCRIERHWETDGDYEEKIKCRGPRRRR